MIVSKNGGFSGVGYIDGVQVLLTGGSFTKTYSPSFVSSTLIPALGVNKAQKKHQDGTIAYSGDASFDINQNALALFSNSRLFKRGHSFQVRLSDSNNGITVNNCFVDNVTLSGSAGGLLNCSISFQSTSDSTPWNLGNVPNLNNTNPPYGYWYSGAQDVRDWTLTFSQELVPMYGNKSGQEPHYMKVLTVDSSLEVSTYEQLRNHSQISVATKSFTVHGETIGEGYSFEGAGNQGVFTHVFGGFAVNGNSTSPILT